MAYNFSNLVKDGYGTSTASKQKPTQNSTAGMTIPSMNTPKVASTPATPSKPSYNPYNLMAAVKGVGDYLNKPEFTQGGKDAESWFDDTSTNTQNTQTTPTKPLLPGAIKPAATKPISNVQSESIVDPAKYALGANQPVAPSTPIQPNVQPPAPQNNYQAATGGLVSIGQNQTPLIQQTIEQMKQNTLNQGNDIAGVQASGAPINYEIGKANALNGVYGTEQNALSNQLSGLVGAQGNQITALNNAGVLTKPEQLPYDVQYGTPGDLAAGNQSGIGDPNGVFKAGQIAQSHQQGVDYQIGVKNLATADNLKPAIVQTLNSHPELNQTPVSALTAINQWFSGQTSDPNQQILAKQVADYVKALGYSPEEAAQIAIQKGATLGNLVDTLYSNYKAANDANKVGQTSISSNNASPGNQWNDYFGA